MSNDRIKRFNKLAHDRISGFEAALIISGVNRYYFTGMPSSAGYLFISAEYSCLLVDFRYYEKAKRAASGIDVLLLENAGKQLSSIFLGRGVGSVCVEDTISLSQYSSLVKNTGAKIDGESGISGIIAEMRAVKDKDEIECITAAQRIAEAAFEKTLPLIKPGATENQIVCELEYNMKLLGSQRCAFDTIGVSGKNSSMPHGTSSDKPLVNGDFLTLDFGASVNGYLSDMTRTVHIGKISGGQKRVYDTVKKALDLAFANIRPGVKCRDIDKVARDYIYSCGFEGCFGHALGHSVGLEIHETPCFSRSDHTVLKPGMVITVEPGIYLEGRFGVRIENMALVTRGGCESLTETTRELIVI